MYLSQRRYTSIDPVSLVPINPPIQDLEVAAVRLLAVGVAFLSISMVVGTMHWSRQEFVSHIGSSSDLLYGLASSLGS